MVKIKSNNHNDRLSVRVKIALSEIINEDEIKKFSRLNLRGFLKPQAIKKHSAEYVGATGISLRERLEFTVSDYDFFFIIEQIVDTTRVLQKNNVPWDRVLWTVDSVFINETTKELRFIYLPIDGVRRRSNLMEFIETIIYSAHPKDNESHCISDFVYFLHGLKGYDYNKIESYIAGVNQRIVNTVKGNTKGKSGFITDKQQEYYNHYNGQQDKGTDLLTENSETEFQEEATGLLNEYDQEDLSGFHSEEGKHPGFEKHTEDDGSTGLLNEENENDGIGEQTGLLEELPSYPTLFRKQTQETISINKPVFRLGKERSYVDYFVSNNNAVSRSHADVITRGDRYYIIDLNSTNKTYVNNRVIFPKVETEIFNGDSIVLGNEEFSFHTN